jgi:hypothetical protein
VNAFERQIGNTFKDYREAGVAILWTLYPPMRAAGMHGRMPCYVPSGKAPYDVAGYYLTPDGTSIGAELKETAEHEHSLQMVPPDKKGSGLQYHQLVALDTLHAAGGVALILWNNGGEIGLLDGAGIALTRIMYEASLKSRNPAKGTRSIKWGMFKPVKLGLKDAPLWLPTAPPPCKKKGVA